METFASFRPNIRRNSLNVFDGTACFGQNFLGENGKQVFCSFFANAFIVLQMIK